MASKFISNSTVTYDVATDGTTSVTHDITLQNATSDFYATSYTLSLDGINPINPTAHEGSQVLPLKVTQNDKVTSIQVDFTNPVVGKDSKRQFTINFTDKTLIGKTGEIWEITTPKLADATSFDFYSTIIKIPNSFGNLAYVSPNPTFRDTNNGKMVFSFDKSASTKTTITAAFGQFQVFSFHLTYHIENPLNQTATADVAIPPDTNYQKMNYTKINPTPSKVAADRDGNWLATFSLKPNQKIDVTVEGAVQLFAKPLNEPKIDVSNVNKDLTATQFWQTNDPKIIALAKELKTPQAIYNFVTSTLTYDYARVAANVTRLGAVTALSNPKSAICTEFTDLFITLARAAGIPAREIEGYAYTENPQIQPLSLVADVLHAWPEYWDNTKQTWIPVDPTWGSTSGIDYFNKLDLRHFVFVVHGADATKPYPAGSYKLGPNPQKDVDVTFGNLPQTRSSNLKIENKILSQLPFSDEIIETKISNPGPVAIYNEDFGIVFDGKIVKTQKIDAILPYGYYETTIDIPYSFLGSKTPAKVGLLLNGSKKTELTTYKTYIIISNLLMLCLLIFFVVFLIYLKFHDGKTKKSSGKSGNISI